MDTEVLSDEVPIPRELENIKIGDGFEGRIDQVRLYEVGIPGRSDHTGTPSVLKDFIDDGGHNACGQVYVPADINEDCYVDLKDVGELALAWLSCSDVTNSSCN